MAGRAFFRPPGIFDPLYLPSLNSRNSQRILLPIAHFPESLPRAEGAGRAPLRIPVSGDDPVHPALALLRREGAEKEAVPAGGHAPSPYVPRFPFGTVNLTRAVTLFPDIWIWYFPGRRTWSSLL